MSDELSNADLIATDLSTDRDVLLVLEEAQRKLGQGDPSFLRTNLRKVLAEFITLHGYKTENKDRHVYSLDP